jgi:spore coat protein H
MKTQGNGGKNEMESSRKETLPNYSLYIHPRQLQELNSDIWSDETVPAKLTIDSKTHIIEVTYRGALIRELKKKSYFIEFIKPKTFFGAREIHLNAEYLDPSLMRNKLSFDFFRTLGALSPQAFYVNLKQNGQELGIYLQLESVDDLFLYKRGLPKGPIFYGSNDDANFSLLDPESNKPKRALDAGYKLKVGETADLEHLRKLIYKINTVSRADFEKEILHLLDVKDYIRWLVGVVCTQNFDGFIHNYALYLNEATQLFQIIPWDYDGTWGRDCKGRKMEFDYVPIRGYNTLTARLLDVPLFRLQYQELLEEALEDHFTISALQPQIASMYCKLQSYIQKDPYRKHKMDQFEAEPEYILQFIKDRNHYLKEHLQELD